MATFTVTNTDDSGAGSLRQAILDANAAAGADTISFDASLAGSTIVLTGGELSITDDTTIDGDFDGSGDNKADITMSGNNASRIFAITGATTDVDLLSLTLTNGFASGYDGGGALYAYSIATLDIADTTIRNSNGAFGGGIVARGAVLTIANSLLSENFASYYGGGVFLFDAAQATITNTTIHGNTSSGPGGGLSLTGSTLNLVNSTVTGNRAGTPPASSSSGGCIDIYGSTVTISNSVVAENSSIFGGVSNDVRGTVNTATNSVFGTNVTGVTNGVNGNLVGVADIGLSALGDHGGTVETRNIEADSVLINAGDNGLAPAGAADANGNTRVVAGTVDVGATEFQLVVTTASDVVDANDGFLSLREAVALANANADVDTITFAASLKGQTIVLSGQLSLTQDVTIDGDVNGDHKADVTISGNGASRIFNITGATTDVRLQSLTLANGYINGATGGAVLANQINSLVVADTTISDSQATYRGGGLSSFNSQTTLINSLVTGCSAYTGGGASVYGGTTTLVNSTVDGNTAQHIGGGIGLLNGTLTVLNSTITANHAGTGVNLATLGGGVAMYSGTAATFSNSVVALNTSGTGYADFDVSTSDSPVVAQNSFFGVTVAITTDNGGNINGGGDPMLGELLDNGGTVLTRSPLDGSPLIGAGSNALLPADTYDIDHDGNTAETLPLDGRDGLRLVGGTVDIGTVEQVVDEVINGTPGRNTIIGGLGNDILNGRGGRDVVRGGAGDDVANGGRGNDLVTGSGGHDKLNGNAGKDTLNGGADSDILWGGADADIFQFSNVSHSAQGPGLSDTIKDFVQGEDVIDLSSAFAFTFLGAVDFTGAAGDLIQRISGSDLLILGDTDGNKKADFRIILEGASGLTLNNGDFML